MLPLQIIFVGTVLFMVSKQKLFTVLWLAGMVGVISTWWLNLPLPEAAQPPLPLKAIKLLALIQPILLLSVAVLIGVALAHKVGLSAPLAEAVASGSPLSPAVKSQIGPGLSGGLVGGVVLSVVSSLWKPFLPGDFLTKGEELSNNTPFLTRILYGGITEELLLRWGVMTLLVWMTWCVLQKRQDEPHATYFVIAIILSALLFGLSHLPIAFALETQVTASLISYIVIGNSLFGLIAGYLYWSTGLEAAMIAHMLAHGVMVTASHLGR